MFDKIDKNLCNERIARFEPVFNLVRKRKSDENPENL